MIPSYLEVEKNWFLAISSLTNTVAAIWRQKNVDPCYQETKKCSSQLLGARKKDDIYLKSEKLVHNQQEHGKKKCFPAIWKWEKLVPSYFEPDKHCQLFGDRNKWIPAIRRPKNVVHNCQEQGKRL